MESLHDPLTNVTSDTPQGHLVFFFSQNRRTLDTKKFIFKRVESLLVSDHITLSRFFSNFISKTNGITFEFHDNWAWLVNSWKSKMRTHIDRLSRKATGDYIFWGCNCYRFNTFSQLNWEPQVKNVNLHCYCCSSMYLASFFWCSFAIRFVHRREIWT